MTVKRLLAAKNPVNSYRGNFKFPMIKAKRNKTAENTHPTDKSNKTGNRKKRARQNFFNFFQTFKKTQIPTNYTRTFSHCANFSGEIFLNQLITSTFTNT